MNDPRSFFIYARKIPEGYEEKSKLYKFEWSSAFGMAPADMLDFNGQLYQVMSVYLLPTWTLLSGITGAEAVKMFGEAEYVTPGQLEGRKNHTFLESVAWNSYERGSLKVEQPEEPKVEKAEPAKVKAHEILEEGAKVLRQRAELRDAEGGERSMAKAVAIFNSWTGNNVSEADGWRFMIALKQAREIQGKFHEDDYVDGANYMALLGECEANRC